MSPTSLMAVAVCEPPSDRVRSLAHLGSAVEVDHNVPVIRYFRSGKEMMRMADVYYEEHNYENAFILYSKFITIFVEKLPKHPQYKQSRPEDIKETKRKVKQAFPRAEDTKAKLKQKFEKEFRIWEERETQRLLEEEKLRKEQEKWDEQRRRKHEEEEEERRQLQEAKERSLREEQQRELEEQRRAILEEQQRAQQREEEEKRALAASAAAAAAAAAAAQAAGGAIPSATPPSIPPPSYDAVKAGGYSVYKPAEDYITPKPTASPVPPAVDRSLKVDRSTKPSNLLSSVPSSKNRYGMRDLFVPVDTVERFLSIANLNTAKNLETCGILAGKLSHDAFTITHIVVPKQTSTSDSCTAVNEGEIFDVMDKKDLITLGWIHTHPTQTAFMSSIDLHTHCPYQVMMAEAIAIVCAPAHNQTGYFSLTPDYGVNFISNCKEAGFHPHPSQPTIYEEGQHVKIASNVSIQMIDMR
ncbi:STAM-binding protein-like A [Patiria miniata]|uniref:MPN domain-containing protein n=1 Tax=Patiria miniata TaxID=46514 RepID=A0A914ABS5_PATMI|nr:STAM-binding protein-like A [Patiria miniata]